VGGPYAMCPIHRALVSCDEWGLGRLKLRGESVTFGCCVKGRLSELIANCNKVGTIASEKLWRNHSHPRGFFAEASRKRESRTSLDAGLGEDTMH